MSVIDGMVGHGEYNQHSSPQMAAIEHIVPWLDEAIAGMALVDTPSTTTVAGFGCSEGSNPIAVMDRVVDALCKRTDRPIQTVHNDLPTNDYSELFKALRPNGRSVFEGSDVYSAAVAGSMYDQLLPPRSLHVAMTFNAIAFYSRRPVERLPGYIVVHGPNPDVGVGEVSVEDAERCARRARLDLDSFLTAWAAKLVPGGKLMIQVFGANDTWRTTYGSFDALNAVLLEMIDEGEIDRAAYDTYYQPLFARTVDELVLPVRDAASPCSALFSLDCAQTYETPLDFVEAFRRSGNANEFGREYMGFVRVFSKSGLRLAFAAQPDLDDTIKEVYTRFERLVREDPERYMFHFISVAAMLTRTEAHLDI